jgi:hypothetical protein
VTASYQKLSKEVVGQVEKQVAAASGVPQDMAAACTQAIRYGGSHRWRGH